MDFLKLVAAMSYEEVAFYCNVTQDTIRMHDEPYLDDTVSNDQSRIVFISGGNPENAEETCFCIARNDNQNKTPLNRICLRKDAPKRECEMRAFPRDDGSSVPFFFKCPGGKCVVNRYKDDECLLASNRWILFPIIAGAALFVVLLKLLCKGSCAKHCSGRSDNPD